MYDQSSYEKENGMEPDIVYSFNSEDIYIDVVKRGELKTNLINLKTNVVN